MDTVIIKIYGPKKFKIKQKQLFLPEIESRKYEDLSETEKQSKRYYLRRFILKASGQERYLPKIDVLEILDKENKEIKYILISEFSIPKLIYGNSLQEVSNKDFEKVISIFIESLSRVGIIIGRNTVANARVSAIHFCKNIILPRDILLQDIISELGKVDINKTVDITTKENKNGGQVFHIYSGTVERVFYDKVVDALRPKNKRKDKGHIEYERDIIKEYNLQNQEVFRYEYRIKKTQTVSRDINKTLKREPRTFVAFKDLFSDNLSKDLLQKSWRDLVQRPENQLALIGPALKFGSLFHIFKKSRNKGGAHSLNNALITYALVCIIKKFGVKELRKLIFSLWDTNHPERLTKKIEKATELTKELPYSDGIAFVDAEIDRYQLITLNLLEKTRYNE